jgi:AcrR family transcriptional regulator/2-hydroxychromene-2-carboxylate isomerase
MTKAVTPILDGTRPVGENGTSMPAELTEERAVALESTYQRLQPRWCGLSKDQVAGDQRRRLYEAMVDISTSRGYQATTISALWARAKVSSHTYYALFPRSEGDPKEACFLGAYDHVVGGAAERINLAYRGEEDPEGRLCRAFEQFALEAASEPQAARFALLEPFGAGQAAFARMDHGREMFEGLIAASISNPSRGATLSPTLAKGIVGGVERVSRAYLLAGKIDELSATANELSAWVSTYRPWSRSTPAETPEGATRLQAGLSAKDERLRILRAAAAIAASDGYSGLSSTRIIRLADVSEKTFVSLYNGADAIEACFLAAVDLLAVEALVCAANASRHSRGWPDAVRSGIVALLDHVAAHPFLGPVAFIEIFSVGPSAIERRSMLLQRFRDQLVNAVPESQRPSKLIAEAIVGAIWAVVHDYVVRGQSDRVAELADDATYLALAPLIGHEPAIQLILGDPRSARSTGPSPNASLTPSPGTDTRPGPEPVWSGDPDVPLVVIDLASVETYVLVRALSDLAVERQGAVWCPLISKPAGLDLDVEAARRQVERLQLPFVRPERHPAPLPRAMRLATFASARACGALFTIRATRLAWAAGADLDCLGNQPSLDDGETEDDLDDYLRLIVREIGLDIEEAKLAMEDGSDWDAQLDQAADCLAHLGIDSAPALRWQGQIYAGLDAISALLADLGKHQPLA